MYRLIFAIAFTISSSFALAACDATPIPSDAGSEVQPAAPGIATVHNAPASGSGVDGNFQTTCDPIEDPDCHDDTGGGDGGDGGGGGGDPTGGGNGSGFNDCGPATIPSGCVGHVCNFGQVGADLTCVGACGTTVSYCEDRSSGSVQIGSCVFQRGAPCR